MSTKWTVIDNQSTVTFNVAHADESTVEGRFDKFHGDIVAEDDKFNRADFTFAIEVKSINNLKIFLMLPIFLKFHLFQNGQVLMKEPFLENSKSKV